MKFTTGKKGDFVFSTREALETAREAEKTTAERTSHTRRRKVSFSAADRKNGENILENVPSSYMTVAALNLCQVGLIVAAQVKMEHFSPSHVMRSSNPFTIETN